VLVALSHIVAGRSMCGCNQPSLALLMIWMEYVTRAVPSACVSRRLQRACSPCLFTNLCCTRPLCLALSVHLYLRALGRTAAVAGVQLVLLLHQPLPLGCLPLDYFVFSSFQSIASNSQSSSHASSPGAMRIVCRASNPAGLLMPCS